MKNCGRCGSTDFGITRAGERIISYCRSCRTERNKKYNARLRANGGSHTPEQWRQKVKQFPRCPGCDLLWSQITPSQSTWHGRIFTKDHILPVSCGGTNDITNIRPLCYRCNASKRDRD